MSSTKLRMVATLLHQANLYRVDKSDFTTFKTHFGHYTPKRLERKLSQPWKTNCMISFYNSTLQRKLSTPSGSMTNLQRNGQMPSNNFDKLQSLLKQKKELILHHGEKEVLNKSCLPNIPKTFHVNPNSSHGTPVEQSLLRGRIIEQGKS